MTTSDQPKERHLHQDTGQGSGTVTKEAGRM